MTRPAPQKIRPIGFSERRVTITAPTVGNASINSEKRRTMGPGSDLSGVAGT